MFAIILGTGAISWNLVTSIDETTLGLGVMAMFVGLIGSLALGLVNAFKREPSPALILAYAAFEGLLLGGFSGFMEARYEGIVVQAVLATLATFGAMLAAYSYGGFRVQGRFRRVVVVATLGYGVFCLINLGLSMTGVVGGAWGLRSMTIMGIPLGVPLGILAVILASFFLAIDFESIENGVRNGLPRRYAWAGAFGLVLTIVWLYVEFLRLLSYFRDCREDPGSARIRSGPAPPPRPGPGRITCVPAPPHVRVFARRVPRRGCLGALRDATVPLGPCGEFALGRGPLRRRTAGLT